MLDHLRVLRAGQDRVEAKLAEHDKHFSLIERQIAGARGDIAIIHEMTVDHTDDIRTIKARLDRLERHAGLSETLKQ
jgi:hypothetical protein